MMFLAQRFGGRIFIYLGVPILLSVSIEIDVILPLQGSSHPRNSRLLICPCVVALRKPMHTCFLFVADRTGIIWEVAAVTAPQVSSVPSSFNSRNSLTSVLPTNTRWTILAFIPPCRRTGSDVLWQ